MRFFFDVRRHFGLLLLRQWRESKFIVCFCRRISNIVVSVRGYRVACTFVQVLTGIELYRFLVVDGFPILHLPFNLCNLSFLALAGDISQLGVDRSIAQLMDLVLNVCFGGSLHRGCPHMTLLNWFVNQTYSMAAGSSEQHSRYRILTCFLAEIPSLLHSFSHCFFRSNF